MCGYINLAKKIHRAWLCPLFVQYSAMRLFNPVILAAALLFAAAFPTSGSNNNYLIVGDSLSKEYAVEGPVLWSQIVSPFYLLQAYKARNWMEILLSLRGAEFSFGTNGSWTDSRAPTGHAYNYAVPGAMTTEWQSALSGGTLLSQFVLSSFDNNLKNQANRVVILLGGNDLNNNYTTYYNGADPTSFIASLLSNYASIVSHIQSVNSTAQIVICTAPDVGVTPAVQNGHPDPAKRALVTALTQTLNAGLAQLAARQGLGLADVYSVTRLYVVPQVISFAGIPLIKGISNNNNDPNDPFYLFSADGFHPNTPSQAMIANEIIRAFNTTFNDGIKPLTGAEIMGFLESQHNKTMDVGYSSWTGSYGITKTGKMDNPAGDGLSNALKYALGLDPTLPCSNALPASQIAQVSGTTCLTLTYSPRWRYASHETVTPRYSSGLASWNTVGPAAVANNGDGSFTASVPLGSSANFMRLDLNVGN